MKCAEPSSRSGTEPSKDASCVFLLGPNVNDCLLPAAYTVFNWPACLFTFPLAHWYYTQRGRAVAFKNKLRNRNRKRRSVHA